MMSPHRGTSHLSGQQDLRCSSINLFQGNSSPKVEDVLCKDAVSIQEAVLTLV